MAKAETPAVEEVTPAQNFDLGIDEFCSRLSATDKRVELIGAFHHCEVLEGRAKDAASAYSARFAAFANRPV